MTVFDKLTAMACNDILLVNEAMSAHTTFRIGGPADYFIIPETELSLISLVQLCKNENIPYFIMGNGSNLLVSDEGFRGAVFSICRSLDKVRFTESVDGSSLVVDAGAGAMLSALAKNVCSRGFAGFEFATGIPGTVGGAVTMNAGAYGGELKDLLISVRVLDAGGNILELDRESMDMSYRHSKVMDEEYIVLSASLRFEKGDISEIASRVAEFGESRRTNQPLDYPSAGSTFKRPRGFFAGKLIQDCGLKGYSIGGAQVSAKHSGFLVNTGNATAADVYALIDYVRNKVRENFGVELEPEVKFLGEF